MRRTGTSCTKAFTTWWSRTATGGNCAPRPRTTASPTLVSWRSVSSDDPGNGRFSCGTRHLIERRETGRDQKAKGQMSKLSPKGAAKPPRKRYQDITTDELREATRQYDVPAINPAGRPLRGNMAARHKRAIEAARR